jgi:hypothetical protein
MMIENPENLWEKKFENLFKVTDKSETEYFLRLVGIALGISNYGDSLSQIYNILGIDNFTKLLHIVSGRTIEFPPLKLFRESLILCLCFILKEKGMSWEEIKETLPFDEDDICPYKYGIKLSHLKKKIKNELYKILVGKNKEE